MITITPEEEPIIRKHYEEYEDWIRKWTAPPIGLSYEDFWRMVADEAKDGAKYD